MLARRHPQQTNVLVSSSRQWNPGDEFIMRGCRRLFASLDPQPINWLLWNRNPDLFVDGWKNSLMRPDFMTNAQRDPCLDLVDVVLLAGTPEWFGKPLDRVYRELLRHPEVPLVILGAGSGGPELKLAPHELEVLGRHNTLITTRSTALAEEINRQLGTTKAQAVPCPAFLCSPIEADLTGRPACTGVIAQSSAVINQAVSEEMYQELVAATTAWSQRPGQTTEVISLYTDEFMRLSRERALKGCAMVYSYEPLDYLERMHMRYNFVLSTRLHGALAAMSCGVPAILLNKDNFRLASTQALYADLLPMLTPAAAFAQLATLTEADIIERSTAIKAAKARLWTTYIELLRTFFATLQS